MSGGQEVPALYPLGHGVGVGVEAKIQKSRVLVAPKREKGEERMGRARYGKG